MSLIHLSCSKYELPDNEDLNSDEARWITEAVKGKYQGRKTGTNGCKEFADYLISELNTLNFQPQEQKFMFRDSINMKNIYVTIPGIIDSIIVVGAHYDGAVNSSIYQAANDNASGITCLLSICKKFSQNNITPNKTIILAFWDGEEYTTSSAFNGSHYFVNNYPQINKIYSYGNLDTIGRLNDCMFYQVDVSIYFKPVFYIDLMSSIINSGNRVNNTYSIEYKSWNKSGSDYVSFRDKNIPFWGWNDVNCREYIHTVNDNLSYISISKIQDIANWTYEFIIEL